MTEFTRVKIYVPEQAGNKTWNPDHTMLSKLKEMAADKFGGFTEYEAKGGWLNSSDELVEENVRVIEILSKETESLTEGWAKSEANWLKAHTDEEVILITVGGEMYEL